MRRCKTELGLGISDPAPDRTIRSEIEAAFMREARIGEQRDIGKRERTAGEKASAGEMPLHLVERGIATLDQVRVERRDGLAEIDQVESAHRDKGFMTVLLPEHPGIHLSGRI